MSTQVDITEAGAQTVTVTLDGVPGATGAPGRGLTDVAATRTTSGALTANTLHPVSATGGAVTVTLPTGSDPGDLVTVRKTDTSANTVTLAPGAGNTLDGGSTGVVLAVTGQGVSVVCDGGGTWATVEYGEARATVAPTAGRPVLRDTAGRAQAAAPATSADVVTKGHLDTTRPLPGVVEISRGGSATVVDSTWTLLKCGTSITADSGFLQLDLTNGGLKCLTSGWYLLVASMPWPLNAAGIRAMSVSPYTATVPPNQAPSTSDLQDWRATLPFSFRQVTPGIPVLLAAGVTYCVYVYQNSGTDLVITPNGLTLRGMPVSPP